MGEGTSEAVTRAGWRRRGSDKDRRRHLGVIPPVVENALVAAATRSGQMGLVLLLTRYYLRPEQLVRARLTEEGLVVPGFAKPIFVDECHREVLGEWLARRRRAHSAQAVRDTLGRLRKAVVADLERQEGDRWPTDWDALVDVGVVALRRLAAERLAEACGFEEAVYHELVHDARADPYAVLRVLSGPARRAIGSGADALVEEIRRAQGREDASS